ncbi:MAG: response regulator [Planctomycetales bacterium]|nr:response regulator [Planctomycetales bacterium]
MTRKVLVIDDNPADAALVRRLLGKIESPRYQCVHETAWEQGADRAAREDFDCVLLDYCLGELDGVQVLQHLRESGVDMPVIACTGAGSEDVAVQALQAGAQDYLSKARLSAESLHLAISNAMEKVALQRLVNEQREELESFASIASHDLRSPLVHVRAYARLLEEDVTDLSEECRDHLLKIHAAVQRMTELIDGLLDYTRTGRRGTNLEDVDLNEVLSEVLADLATLLKNAGAEASVTPLPVVRGDKVGLRQLFQNLVANAVKYNRSAQPRVEVSGEVDGDQWKLSVVDNGIGIEEQYLTEIFKPLRRLHTQQEFDGCGLGLACAARIVKQHSGKIWAESRVGHGATIHVLLPTLAGATCNCSNRIDAIGSCDADAAIQPPMHASDLPSTSTHPDY